MKFSQQFGSETQAQAREQLLKASGYSAWRTRKADGMWQVFWWVRN